MSFASDHALEQRTPIVSHHDAIKWFEAIPGEQLCIRVHGTQMNGRYGIMENIAAPGTAIPMHFHAEDEIFYVLEGTVTFSIDGDVFDASVGSIVVIPAGAHHAWRNRSNAPIRMSTFFSPGGVEELYPKLVGLSLEELSAVVEPFGSGIVGPPIDERQQFESAQPEHEEYAMKVALLGATGFVGSALLKEALDRGHVVTAIVRHPEKLEKHDGLTTKAGDVYDAVSLATLIRGNEATISAFNPGWKNPNLYDDQVRGTASIIAAIKKAGIKRVLWVGGAGGLEVKPGVRVIDSPDMPLWVKPGSLATINALDQLRKEPELEWCFLSPSAELMPGQRTGKFRLGNDQLLVDATGHSKISVQDYAVAMIDELEHPTHVRQRFTVGY